MTVAYACGVIGKLRDAVFPPTVAPPSRSTAIAYPELPMAPPRYVAYQTDRPVGSTQATKQSSVDELAVGSNASGVTGKSCEYVAPVTTVAPLSSSATALP